MKNIYIQGTAAIGVLLALSCGQKDTPNTGEGTTPVAAMAGNKILEIKPDQSSIMWKGTMMGLYAHEGTLNFNEGSIELDGNKIVGGSFTADMSTIYPVDNNFDPKKDRTPAKLVGHLSSPDFFDINNFPDTRFEILSAEGKILKGILTIRGISHEEVVKDISWNQDFSSVTGSLIFNRKKYDVSWDSQMKDMVLSDDIVLKVVLQF